MKYLWSALCIIALATAAAAQAQVTSNNPPDVQILKAKWSRSYAISDFGGNPLFSAEIGSGLYTEQPSNTAGKVPVTTRRAVRNRSTPVPETHEYVTRPTNPNDVQLPSGTRWRRSGGYTYQATIKNNGGTTIKALSWEYVFSDPLSQQTIARHRFHTRAKISPGKEKKLSAFTVAPPTKVINAKAVKSKPDQPFTEQVLITRIEYADGSVWERPSQ